MFTFLNQWQYDNLHAFQATVEPRLSESLYNRYNEILGITNDFLQPAQNYNKMYRTEPRFNQIRVITNPIHKRKRKMYLDITNKCQL